MVVTGSAGAGQRAIAPGACWICWRRAQPAACTAKLAAVPAKATGTLSLLDEFVAGDLIAQAPAGRILASVLFTDIVESTARAAALGDGVWAQVLDRHDAIARSAIETYGGRFVKETGDGVLAVFDAPARGIECAKRLRSALSHAGIAIRAGIHTGEIELRGEDVSGIGVHIAARVAGLAAPASCSSRGP